MRGARLFASSALLFIAACWGATFVVAKHALASISPEWLTFYRFLLAGAVLLLLTRRDRWNGELVRAGVTLGVLVFLGYWLQTRGLLYTTPSRSAFITGAGVVLVPFFEHFIFRSGIRALHVIGTLLAVAGLYLLVGGIEGWANRGDMLTAACAGAFSIHVVLASRYSGRFEPLPLAAVQVATVAVCAAPTLPFSPHVPLSAGTIAVIVALALVNTSLAIYVMMWAQARISAAEAAIILSFEPVAAAITSVAVGDDPLAAPLVAGGSLVVAGMLVAQQRRSTVAASP